MCDADRFCIRILHILVNVPYVRVHPLDYILFLNIIYVSHQNILYFSFPNNLQFNTLDVEFYEIISKVQMQ